MGQKKAEGHSGTSNTPLAWHSCACLRVSAIKNMGGHHQLKSWDQSAVKAFTFSQLGQWNRASNRVNLAFTGSANLSISRGANLCWMKRKVSGSIDQSSVSVNLEISSARLFSSLGIQQGMIFMSLVILRWKISSANSWMWSFQLPTCRMRETFQLSVYQSTASCCRCFSKLSRTYFTARSSRTVELVPASVGLNGPRATTFPNFSAT